MQRRWRLLAGALGTGAISAGLLAVAPPGASAKLFSPTEADVTIVHAIQGVPVDVYAGGALITDADGFAPGENLELGAVPPGPVDVEVYAHTVTPAPAAPPGTGAVIDTALTVPAGPLDVSVAAGLDEAGTPTLFPFVNDVSEVPAGQGRLSVRHTAAAPAVDIYASDILLAAGVTNGQSKDFTVPAGTYSVEVFAAGADPATATPVIGPIDATVAADGFVQAYASTGLPSGSSTPTIVAVAREIPSRVTIAHGIPGTPVDVYVDGALAIPGFQPKTTVGPLAAVGDVTVGVYAAIPNPPADASARVDALVIDPAPTLDVPANADLTVIAHLAESGDPTLTGFANDLSFAGVGNARVAIRHTAAAPAVDICVDGAVFAPNLTNPNEVVAEVPAGTYEVAVVLAGAGCGSPVIGPAPVTLESGNFYEAYAIGEAGPPSTLDLFLVGPTPLDKLFHAVTPTRIADTRDGTGGVAVERLAPGEVLRITPGGKGGVPTSGVGGVALNVTAAAPSADGYLTVYACEDPAPESSNVNYVGGQIAEPNAVIVGLQPITGDFCITTYAETDVVVDVNGWMAVDSGFTPQSPILRIADTRDGSGGVPVAPLQPGEVLTVDVSDDATVGAAALNVTAANTTAPGYLTVYPCDATTPYASNVNYGADQAGAPNAVITGLDAEGQVCITTYAPVDVFVDLTGTFAENSSFVGTVPTRIADTRDGTGGVAVAKLAPGEVLEVQVAEDGGVVPATGVDAVTLNVTATQAEGNGYLTVYACGGPPPYASSVNYTTEELASPNAVISGLSDDGTVCITSFAPVDVVVDVTGYFAI